MAKQVCRSRSRDPSKNKAGDDSTPHPEAGVARGVLVGARIAKRFDVPTPTRRNRTPRTKTKKKKRRGRPPKNAPLPRPETPPPTMIIKEVYYGTVTGYNHLDADYDHHDGDVGLYRVHYDDGDTEVLDPDEMYAAFLLHNSELLRMDIERCGAYPSLASKIAPSWREATTGGGGGGGGGGGLAHQRHLTQDELIVLDAERIGYWESYKAYNISTGVARPLPFSPSSSRDNRKHRPLEQDAAVATRTSTGGQTAGELSGSNEVVQPTSAGGSASSMITRRSERASTRASTTSAAAAAAALTDGSSVLVDMSPTHRRNKRRGAEAAVTSEVAAGSSVGRSQGSSKRRKRTSGTTSSNANSVIGSNLADSERGGQEAEGSDSTETSTRVKEEASVTSNTSSRHGWGLFRWSQTVGFGDICDLT